MHTPVLLLAACLALAAPAAALYAPDATPPPMDVALVLAIVPCEKGVCIEVREGSLDDLRPGVRLDLTVLNEAGIDARLLFATAGHMDDPVDEEGNVTEVRRMPLLDLAVAAGGEAVGAAEIPGDAHAVQFSAQTPEASDEILVELPIYTMLAFGEGESDEDLADNSGMSDEADEAAEPKGAPGLTAGMVVLALMALAFGFSRRL